MAQTRLGAIKLAAAKCGVSAVQYMTNCQAGLKWCYQCRTWKATNDFGVDNSRFDGRASRCHKCRRVKIRKSTKGQVSAFKGKVHTVAARALMSASRMGNKNRIGRTHSEETKQKLSKTKRAASTTRRGDLHPRWKGGITPINRQIRTSAEYLDWRLAVFTRDGFTCQRCGNKRGRNLHAHHIKSFADYPALRFTVSNGLTLCRTCHELVHTKSS